jgi:hypothetical protein
MMRREPKTFRILTSDYLSLLLGLAPMVLWAMYIATAFGIVFRSRRSGTELAGQDPVFLALAAVVTLVCVPLLFIRLQRVKELFAKGTLLQGEITSVKFIKDRGRVEYKFPFGGLEIQTGAAVHKTAATTRLRPGQKVELVVDHQNPKRALIVDLYC